MRGVKRVAVVLCVAAALALGCARSGARTSAKNQSSAGQGAIPVTVAAAVRQDVPIYLDGLGTVQAFNTATLRAQVSGRLIAVPFKEGDEVEAGAVLARVDPRTYQAALDQAIAKKAQDEAQLAAARLDLKRYQDLVPEGYVTQQQVDQQRAVVEQDAALIQSDAAAIESARVQLSYCTITAPFAGVVGLRQVDVGNLVSASDQTGIVVLTQIKPIAVTFTLPEQHFGEIRGAAGAAGRDSLPVLAMSPPARSSSRPASTTSKRRYGRGSSSTCDCWCAPSAMRSRCRRRRYSWAPAAATSMSSIGSRPRRCGRFRWRAAKAQWR